MAKILSRKNWTSTSPGGSSMDMKRSRGIVAHYPAAGKDIGVISQAQEASRLRGWRNYHVKGRGWSDLGYNYAIGQSGRIYEGRGLRVGAHATGHNSTTVGVLFIVGDNEPLTEEAEQAFKALRAYLRGKGVGNGVWGHQQMSGASTRCPGPYIMSSIRDGSLTGGASAAEPGASPKKYKTVNTTAPLGLYDKDPESHSRIADWQKNALGYRGKKADGYFGPDTDRDTRALQRQLGVRDDGLVGDNTMAAWEKAGKPKLGKSGKSGGGGKSISRMADEVIAGKHGNGHSARRRSLGVSASTYAKVREEVNRRARGGRGRGKSISTMASEVLAGKHGNGHEQRRRSLGVSRSLYQKVRAEVNRRA